MKTKKENEMKNKKSGFWILCASSPEALADALNKANEDVMVHIKSDPFLTGRHKLIGKGGETHIAPELGILMWRE